MMFFNPPPQDELIALHRGHHEQLEGEIQAVRREIESEGKAKLEEEKSNAGSQEGKSNAGSQEGKSNAGSQEEKSNAG